MESNPCNRL